MAETFEIKPYKDWRCDEDGCPSFDGKRCMALGHRPSEFCEPKIGRVKKAIRKKKNRIRKLETLVSDLLDDFPCSLDHHDSCQSHDWFGDRECPHARAKRILKRKLNG